MTDEAKAARERGILFSAPMVREILADRKTKTRRIVRELPGNRGAPVGRHVMWFERGREDPTRWCGHDGLGSLGWVKCPYGEPGDRLWVRETWQATRWYRDWEAGHYEIDGHAEEIPKDAKGWSIVYAADEGWPEDREERGFPWRPGIFLPRWASRILLEVESIGVERLYQITEGDALAEGVAELDVGVASVNGERATGIVLDPRAKFFALWESINGRESLDANPWVWVVGFRVLAKERKEAADVVITSGL